MGPCEYHIRGQLMIFLSSVLRTEGLFCMKYKIGLYPFISDDRVIFSSECFIFRVIGMSLSEMDTSVAEAARKLPTRDQIIAHRALTAVSSQMVSRPCTTFFIGLGQSHELTGMSIGAVRRAIQDNVRHWTVERVTAQREDRFLGEVELPNRFYVTMCVKESPDERA